MCLLHAGYYQLVAVSWASPEELNLSDIIVKVDTIIR